MSSLKNLLLTYEQVKPPEQQSEQSEQFFPQQTRYDRMVNYISSKKQSEKTNNETDDVKDSDSSDGFMGWKQTTVQPTTTSSVSRARRVSSGSDYNTFVDAYDKYLEKNPQYSKYRDVLTQIAGLESSYKPAAKNSKSSALGWFQFLDGTRRDYDNSSREDFANNYDLQFDVASKHMDSIMKQLEPYKNQIKERGLTDLQAAYGMWWRPKSMKNYLMTGKDDYVNAGDGMTITKILEYAS